MPRSIPCRGSEGNGTIISVDNLANMCYSSEGVEDAARDQKLWPFRVPLRDSPVGLRRNSLCDRGFPWDSSMNRGFR